MENLVQDLRYGLRVLLLAPAFTFAAIIALAVGTGANTAIFSVVNAVVLRPLPYGNPDRLIILWSDNTKTGLHEGPWSLPDFIDYRDQNAVFDEIASFSYDDFNLGGADRPERVQGTMVSANFFSVLGVTPQVGRAFLPGEDKAAGDRVAILSYGLWQRRFGGDKGILEQTILVNGAGFIVVGVAPRSFQSPEKGDEIWVPMSFDGGDRLRVPSANEPEDLKNRSRRFLKVVARAKPGVSIGQMRADAATIAGRLEQQYPEDNAGITANVVPLQEQIVGPKMQFALPVLLVLVSLVLLIACANVANLMLARASARQKEIAIRVALGAGRLRLIRQLLTESLALALVGGALGLLLAYGCVRLLLAINPANIPRLSEIGIDGRVLGYTLLVSILSGLIFGLAPALQASKPDLNETLKEGARGSSGGAGRQLVRSLLVVAEIAITTFLLIGAGLMIKSFYGLQRVDAGFESENVLTMQVTLPSLKYPEDRQIAAFFDETLKRVRTLPGVESAGAITNLPMGGGAIKFRFTVDGRPPASPNERLAADYNAVSSDYFRTMRVRLLSGREFTEQDREKSPPVIIINNSIRQRFFPDEDPVGRHISIVSERGVSREIVGVVADVKHSALDSETELQTYVPCLQKPWNFMAIVVHSSSDPTQLASAVRDEVLAVDNSQPVYDIKTMWQVVSDSLSQQRVNMLLLVIFAGVALILAAVGIYGVMNYSVTQRTHEIGIRLALGAARNDILRMIVGQGMLLVAAGMIIGLVAAFWFGRFVESLLFGVSARDPLTFIVIPLVLGLVALAACLVPARRATRVDPVIALRAE